MNFQAIIRQGRGRHFEAVLATWEIQASTPQAAREIAAEWMGMDPRWDDLRFGQNCEVRYLPQVGDGAHFGGNGDAYPVTVVRVSKSGHRVWVQSARHKIAESDRGVKEGPRVATFWADPNGAISVFSRRKDGSYQALGGGSYLGAGYATAYNPHV